MTKILSSWLGFALLVATAQAQTIYLSESNQISAFDATSGAVINWPLITEVSYPGAVAISGTNMFVPCFYSPAGFIGLFTTSGAVVDASLFTVNGYSGVTASGSNIYIITSATTVGTYTTSGTPLNPALIDLNGLPLYVIQGPVSVSGNHLFLEALNYDYEDVFYEYNATTGELITNSFFQSGSPSGPFTASDTTVYAMSSTSTIGTYDATTGATMNSSFITNLNSVHSIALYGNDLYVLDNEMKINGVDHPDAHVGKYDATTGAVINTDLVDLGPGISPFGTEASAIAVGPQILPVVPAMTSPTSVGSAFSFTWNAISNADYQVQCSTNLQPGNWMNLGSIIIATNVTVTSSYPETNNQGYYRIVNQPNGH